MRYYWVKMALTISQKKYALVKRLYEKKQYSAREIALHLDVSIDAVYAFLRKHKIPRRTLVEQRRSLFARKELSFKIRSRLSENDRLLKTIGVVLYWGEGFKAERAAGVDFANSDAEMVVVFIKFLRRICGVDEKRLRVLLYCYANQDVPSLVQFWSKTTDIPHAQFTKPYVRKDFRLGKEGKMPHGLVHIRYCDKKLLNLLREWIKEYKCVGGGVVNRSRL